MADEETLKRFESFKETLCDGSLELQITISKQMTNLAINLGPEFTRAQLLPFLSDYINVHDEILVIISEQLEHFIPLVGGYEFSQPVLEILIKLCHSEETFVRDMSVETLRGIAENLNCEQMEKLMLPIVETLGSEEDWFTSKCSAAALYPIIYKKVNDAKKADLRNNFRVLIQDESPIVRRATAIRLLELIPLLDDTSLRDQFIPVFDNISKDDLDSVRVYAVDIAVELARRLTQNEIEEFIFQTVEDWAEDPSWKMRQKLAEYIATIQEVIPFGKTRGKILAMYQKLVKDTQCEVRIHAASNLVNYCRSLKMTYEAQPNYEDNFEPVFHQSILPQIRLLVTDGNDEIRYVLSSIIVSLRTVIREDCFKKLILPLIIEILEGDPSTPVQANILNSFDSFPTSIDITQYFHSIGSVLKALLENSTLHWRTRRSLLVALMHIGKRCTRQYFLDNLKDCYAGLLGDKIYAVRRSAPIILPLLAKQYGMEWVVENMVSLFAKYKNDCRYLYRYLPMFAISELLYPSVDLGRKPEYFRDLKVLLDSTTNEETKTAAAKTLIRLSKLVEKINEKFEEQPYRDIFLIQNVEDFRNDDITLYAENIIEVINDNHKHNIFGIEKETVLSGSSSYLEGLLRLIYNEFLSLTHVLFEDTIVNIQIRSVYIFHQMRHFIEDLNMELQDDILASAIRYTDDISGSIHDLKLEPLQGEHFEPTEIGTDSIVDETTFTNLEKISLKSIPDVVADTIAGAVQSRISEGENSTKHSTNDELSK